MTQWNKGRWLVQLNWEFQPHYVFLGVFWRRWQAAMEFYVCVVPLLPIRLYIQDMHDVGKTESQR